MTSGECGFCFGRWLPTVFSQLEGEPGASGPNRPAIKVVSTVQKQAAGRKAAPPK
jgi:hypothetical protein